MAEKLKICSGCNKRIPFNSDCECLIKKRKELEVARSSEKNNKELKTNKWRKMRAGIIYRDGGLCVRCLVKYNIINGENLTVHHIKSRLHYPELVYEEENLITLCMSCNNRLGTTDKLDFPYKVREKEIREVH